MGVKESREETYTVPESVYDIVETKNDGEKFNFSELKGKVVYGLLTQHDKHNCTQYT